MNIKENLRNGLKIKREALTPLEVGLFSSKIFEKLVSFVDWNKTKVVHLYLSIDELNEISTKEIIDFISQNYPNINIIIPNQKAKSSDVPFSQKYDLLILPTLGFDRHGNRLGYGGGYYDKLVAQNKIKQKIGLAYSLSQLPKIPVETHDQKLDSVITEQEIILCSYKTLQRFI